MALVGSNSFEMGQLAPGFELYDTISGQTKSLNQLKGSQGTAIFFICNHCPYVIHVNHGLVQMANDYLPKGISFIAISSNDVKHYPQDGPERMQQVAAQLQYPFPYLYDETQEVAKAYNASCTPDLYLFDAGLKAVYHGQLDDSRPRSGVPVTAKDFRRAIDYLLKAETNPYPQHPSVGCSIKWKR
ncbi:MAG: thioredoxin family protein [Bacteroidota bacterium]